MWNDCPVAISQNFLATNFPVTRAPLLHVYVPGERSKTWFEQNLYLETPKVKNGNPDAVDLPDPRKWIQYGICLSVLTEPYRWVWECMSRGSIGGLTQILEVCFRAFTGYVRLALILLSWLVWEWPVLLIVFYSSAAILDGRAFSETWVCCVQIYINKICLYHDAVQQIMPFLRMRFSSRTPLVSCLKRLRGKSRLAFLRGSL